MDICIHSVYAYRVYELGLRVQVPNKWVPVILAKISAVLFSFGGEGQSLLSSWTLSAPGSDISVNTNSHNTPGDIYLQQFSGNPFLLLGTAHKALCEQG